MGNVVASSSVKRLCRQKGVDEKTVMCLLEKLADALKADCVSVVVSKHHQGPGIKTGDGIQIRVDWRGVEENSIRYFRGKYKVEVLDSKKPGWSTVKALETFTYDYGGVCSWPATKDAVINVPSNMLRLNLKLPKKKPDVNNET